MIHNSIFPHLVFEFTHTPMCQIPHNNYNEHPWYVTTSIIYTNTVLHTLALFAGEV